MEISDLIDNFEFLDGWEDKYRYIIELGEKLSPLPAELHTDEWNVRGCQSQVWHDPHMAEGKISIEGHSDAMIVKGLIAIVLMIYNHKSPAENKSIAVDGIFAKLGLEEHLSPSRRNGLTAMTEKILHYADVL